MYSLPQDYFTYSLSYHHLNFLLLLLKSSLIVFSTDHLFKFNSALASALRTGVEVVVAVEDTRSVSAHKYPDVSCSWEFATSVPSLLPGSAAAAGVDIHLS